MVGEIRLFGGGYAPEGWLLCAGQSLAVNQYQALFSLIGTTYGGDGVTTFKLPDLRGRLPIGQGQGTGLTARALGQAGGASMVQVVDATMPVHMHSFSVSGTEGSTNVVSPGAALATPAAPASGAIYAYATPGTGVTQAFPANIVSPVHGNSQAHANVMPYLALTYIIAAEGMYPMRPN